MIYELYISGDENIERTRDYFDGLSDAVDEAEARSSGDTRPWQFKDGRLVLVDDNNGHGIAIAQIKAVEEGEKR